MRNPCSLRFHKRSCDGSPLSSSVSARTAPLAVLHSEHVWGTVVSFDVRDRAFGSASEESIRDAIEQACSWLHEVDRVFSTFREDSLVTAIRRGDSAEQMTDDFNARDRDLLADVLDACDRCAQLTDGAFDAWRLPGGFDPSGYVKGWAADIAAEILSKSGLSHFMIDAGGDIVCRGGESPTEPWHIGIRHPDKPMDIMANVTVQDGSVATSGIYERGQHVFNPASGDFTTAARAATVIGPDAGIADAVATALIVQGVALMPMVQDLPGGLAEWSALVVVGDAVTSIGDAFS